MKRFEYEATANYLPDFLLNETDGLLIKFRFEQGLDEEQLQGLYDILEIFRIKWKHEKFVRKEIIYNLNTIIPGLLLELERYKDDERYEDYLQKITDLDTAIAMCLNPDPNDPSFNKPLRQF